jgi:D-arabinitol dehydrogenase (NADP+)
MFGAGLAGVSTQVSVCYFCLLNFLLLVLAWMHRMNGGCKSVTAAPSGLKMDLAKKLDTADKYVELSRTHPEEQFKKLKKGNPHGFDIVIDATGSPNSRRCY